VAKLSITTREDAKKEDGLLLRGYKVAIDGQEIEYLRDIELKMGVDEFNHCTLSFFVDELEVDAEFLAALEAHIKAKNK
jgi:hypothetical protein